MKLYQVSTYIGLHQDYCVLCHNPDVQSMQSKIIFLVSEAFMVVLDCRMTYLHSKKALFFRMLPHQSHRYSELAVIFFIALYKLLDAK